MLSSKVKKIEQDAEVAEKTIMTAQLLKGSIEDLVEAYPSRD